MKVPQELIDILDERAGRKHSLTGSVVQALADILTRYDELKGYDMAKDVKVIYTDGEEMTFPKIDRITEGPHALRLEVKKYPGVLTDPEMKHIVSIPYTAMSCWVEKD